MDEEIVKSVAAQLRKPAGEQAEQIALKMNESNAFLNRMVFGMLEKDHPADLLEIGMGNGYFVKELFGQGIKSYTGLDYSADMVTQAQELNRSQENAKFIRGNAEDLPFPDNNFDAVITLNTIYFWDEPVKVLREIKRVLKPGGKLLAGIRPAEKMRALPFTRYGFRLYEKDEIEKVFADAGFSEIYSEERDEPGFQMDEMVIELSSLVTSGTRL